MLVAAGHVAGRAIEMVESERLEEPWAPYLARKEGKRHMQASLPA